MHIRVILPVIGDSLLEEVQKESASYAFPGTTIDVVSLERGTASIESEYDEALAAPGILDRVEQAKADGVDGIFITCFGDPGVHAAREIIDAPVVGGFEPAVLTAMSLGERAAIITVLPNVLPMLRGQIHRAGVQSRIGTIRYVDIPVLGLEDHSVLVDRLFEQALDAVTKAEADVIILGCTGMLGVADQLRGRLEAKGFSVPVIDPTAAAIKWLEGNIAMGLKPSRTTYMTPPAKNRSA